MSEKKEHLHELAGGWITERTGTDVPAFLKLAFPVIGLGCVAYIVLQMMGDVNHATRGKFVQQFNQVSQTSPTFQYIVATLALIYVVVMLAFTYRAFKED